MLPNKTPIDNTITEVLFAPFLNIHKGEVSAELPVADFHNRDFPNESRPPVTRPILFLFMIYIINNNMNVCSK